MKLKNIVFLTVAASVLVFGSTAQAALTLTGHSCGLTGMSYDDCSGSWDGNNKGNPGVEADVASQILADFGFVVGSSSEISSGGGSSGTLDLGGAITGLFAIALKAGDAFSLYSFDGGVSGISSINYDTLGVGWFTSSGIHQFGKDLSHADIYLPVPEPETYAMLLAGLGLLGFSLRKQKQ